MPRVNSSTKYYIINSWHKIYKNYKNRRYHNNNTSHQCACGIITLCIKHYTSTVYSKNTH